VEAIARDGLAVDPLAVPPVREEPTPEASIHTASQVEPAELVTVTVRTALVTTPVNVRTVAIESTWVDFSVQVEHMPDGVTEPVVALLTTHRVTVLPMVAFAGRTVPAEPLLVAPPVSPF
jgi:hypothetical protein